MRMTWIGSAWNALIGVGVGVGVGFGIEVVGVEVVVVEVVAFVARCAACSGPGAANCATSLPCAVASGTFPVLAAATATQCTRRRAVRSPVLGGARFHRVQPGLSDG